MTDILPIVLLANLIAIRLLFRVSQIQEFT